MAIGRCHAYGHVGTDGKIEYKYHIDSSASAAVRGAITDAINMWNSWSNVTGFIFRTGGSDLQFKPNAPVRCGSYQDTVSRVFWDAALAAAAGRDRAAAAAIFAHEVGHFLALNEAGIAPEPPTIMNNPRAWTATYGCEIAANSTVTRQVLYRDAVKAKECTELARQERLLPGYGYESEQYVGGNCVDTYWVVDYYDCSDGCWYVYSEWVYVGSECRI